MSTMEVKIDEACKESDECQKKKEEIFATHTKCVIFFGLKPDEEQAKSSVTFLKVFQEFIKNAVDAMPPEEKKKRGAGRATAPLPSSGPPGGGMMAHMAEI